MINLNLRLPKKPLQTVLEFIADHTLFVLVSYLMYLKFAWFSTLVASDLADHLSLEQLNHFLIPVRIYESFVLLSMSFSLLFKGRNKGWAIVAIDLFVSLLMVIDLVCYRGYKNFLSPLLLQAPRLEAVRWWTLLRPVDLLFLADGLLLLGLMAVTKINPTPSSRRHGFLFLLAVAIPVSYLSYAHDMADIEQRGYPVSYLFRKSWAPHETINHLTPVGYHLYDLYLYWQDYSNRTLSASDRAKIEAWYQSKHENLPDNQYAGMLKGKNLIFIQVESLEQFVVKREIDGQAITPNLNGLLKHSLYFPNFYEQVHEGTSSDADLLANTSVYPLLYGGTFMHFPNNSYNSLPVLLGKQGYSTLAIHPDNGIRWNWLRSLSGIGFSQCIDSTQLKMDETIGLGLSDGSFLRQVTPIIAQQKQPFYTFMVTLTNHGPFDLPQSYRELQLDPTLDSTKLGGYFQSVRYTDQQIGEFLQRLDQDGLLDNTVVVIYGDHTGIHKFYNDEVDQMPTKETWWQSEENNWRIPFLIYAKDLAGQEIATTGGQVDILPTISYLMGVDPSQYETTAMGRNLLNTKKSLAVLADGTVVGDSPSDQDKVMAVQGLELADKMIKSNYFAPLK